MYRSTLAWKTPGAEIPGEALPPFELALEEFEVGGAVLISPHAPIKLEGVSHDRLFGCSVFFGAAPMSESVGDIPSAGTLDFAEINGQDFRDTIKADRTVRTNKFSSPELAELSRRTGLQRLHPPEIPAPPTVRAH